MVCFQTKKSQIWVNFVGPMVNVGVFFDHLKYFMATWCSLCSFVIFFPIWNVWTEKNVATLISRGQFFKRSWRLR
jgi:hypothetical protein